MTACTHPGRRRLLPGCCRKIADRDKRICTARLSCASESAFSPVALFHLHNDEDIPVPGFSHLKQHTGNGFVALCFQTGPGGEKFGQ
jgi:hypothetical protein